MLGVMVMNAVTWLRALDHSESIGIMQFLHRDWDNTQEACRNIIVIPVADQHCTRCVNRSPEQIPECC